MRAVRPATQILRPASQPLSLVPQRRFAPRTAVPETERRGLVVFDKDGTLIDFHSMWGPWVEDQARHLQKHTDEPIADRYFDLMGYDADKRKVRSLGPLIATPMHQLFRFGVDVLEDTGMERDDAEHHARSVWNPPDPVDLCQPLADLPELFSELREMGFEIGIFTTDCRGPTIATLDHLGVTKTTSEEMLACGDDPIPSKPQPDQILHLCDKVDVPPEKTVMVGDTPTDMAAGRNANCGLNVGVLGGASTAEDIAEHADLILRDIRSLPSILRKFSFA